MSMTGKEDWTVATYAAHNEALRLADEKLRDAEQRFLGERDRRYAEVKQAEEKALRVKDEADKAALALAREIQSYKDEKANQLREQINRERGDYVTQQDLKGAIDKIDATLMPLVKSVTEFHAGQQSGIREVRYIWGWIFAAAVSGATLFQFFIAPHLTK